MNSETPICDENRIHTNDASGYMVPFDVARTLELENQQLRTTCGELNVECQNHVEHMKVLTAAYKDALEENKKLNHELNFARGY